MDVIIHGKPLDAGERFSPGIDKELARKVVSEVFAMGSIKESEALIVDARYWQGTWNSVYTLLLSQTVKDTAGRGSYFAISLIIPQRYCCFISEVYKLLETVVRENVLGVYLNNRLQYIIPNFEDTNAFEKLCSELESKYHNFEKPFDSSFKPRALNNDEYCSIHDCDSLSILQKLKEKGRIIVTENTETKDALATKSAEYYRMVQQVQGEIQRKNNKIRELESQMSQIETAAKQASTNANGKVRKLELKISELENSERQLEISKQNAESTLSDLKKIFAQAAPFLKESLPSPGTPKVSKLDGGIYNSNNKRFNINCYLSLINTLLLALILGLISFKGCSGNTLERDEDLLNSLKSAVTEKHQIIESLQDENESLQGENESLQGENERLKAALDNCLQELEKIKNKNKSKKNNNTTQQTSKAVTEPSSAGDGEQ